MNIVYGHQWILPVPWPPHSPDLNSLVFLYWERMKETIYKAPVEDEQESVAIIVAAATEIQHNSWRVPKRERVDAQKMQGM